MIQSRGHFIAAKWAPGEGPEFSSLDPSAGGFGTRS